MTPEQLRASILQYAMEGKLVKQNSNDEPASELLKKIENEKAELVKEGKIKKSKKLPVITDDEKLFDIPDSWEWVRVRDIILETIGGGTPSKADAEYWNGNIPWISVKDIHEGDIEITHSQDSITEKGMNNSSTNLVKAGVLITVMRMAVGRIAILKINACINQDLRALITSKYFYDKYLLYMYSQLDLETSGMTVKGLKINNLLNAVFPLPPLEEQRRIVAKIEKLMPLVDEYAESYNRLQKIDNEFEDRLKQSVLQYAMEGKLVKQDPSDEPASELIKKIENEKAELIKEGKIKKSKKLAAITDDEKPFDIPDSWEWIRLGNVGDWGAGATPSRQHPEYYGGNVLWLKTGDLNDDVIRDTSEKITEAGVANSSVKVNQLGNILIAMYGATIGKLGIVGKTLVTNQACCGCTPFEGIYNLYLFYYLLSARTRLIELGSGGAQPNISKTKIEKFLFPLPPLEEQKRIVAKIEKFRNSVSRLSK